MEDNFYRYDAKCGKVDLRYSTEVSAMVNMNGTKGDYVTFFEARFFEYTMEAQILNNNGYEVSWFATDEGIIPDYHPKYRYYMHHYYNADGSSWDFDEHASTPDEARLYRDEMIRIHAERSDE